MTGVVLSATGWIAMPEKPYIMLTMTEIHSIILHTIYGSAGGGCLSRGGVCLWHLPREGVSAWGFSSGWCTKGFCQGRYMTGVVGSAQGSGCVCVCLQMSSQGVCPEGVSGGVSIKWWCLP